MCPIKLLAQRRSAGEGFTPPPSQKLRTDVFRHTFPESENVCHDGGLLACVTLNEFWNARGKSASFSSIPWLPPAQTV